MPEPVVASVELTLREPTAPEREVALDYEIDWPVHVFESR